ncbi:MAG: diaminopimelate decarboxylase [Bryobacterales bacterium]|nr:diaminopimelate decarboxylase [Bryobacterales bacterium]
MPLQEFHYRDGQLLCESSALRDIARAVGTPAYVYSSRAIRDNYRAYERALAGLPHQIHYAVKANSSLAVLSLLAAEGAGFDIVSGGELYRVLLAGGDPASVVYSGVGKTAAELEYALEQRIGTFNCESEQELDMLREVAARLGARPAVALRVNPNIDARTHPYISTGLNEHKFGIELQAAEDLYGQAAKWRPLRFSGVSCHIGSQIFETEVFAEAVGQLLDLAARLRACGVPLHTIDLGGGLAVGYEQGQPSASIASYCQMLRATLAGSGLELAIEPGRSITGQAGTLLTSVLVRKQAGSKTFLVVDGAMNDLLRPALYGARHEILPVAEHQGERLACDVVGPVCETGDFLATGRDLPACSPGDLLAVATAGAYGFVQASNYNSRPRAAEVLVDGETFRVVRKREAREDLVRGETC